MPDHLREALADVATPGRQRHHGAVVASPGITLKIVRGRDLAAVIARKGRAPDLARVVQATFGAALPTSPRYAAGPTVAFIWMGHAQWLATATAAGGEPLADALARTLAGLASITEQSDGYRTFEVAGHNARDMLAKLCALDLHPAAFPAGSTAMTLMSHTSVQITRIEGEGTFEIMVPTSFAADFWQSCLGAAAEFGVAVST